MAADQTQNWNEIIRRLRLDGRLLLNFEDDVWRVRATQAQVNLFGGPQPVRRRVAISLGVSNDIIMSWVVPGNPTDNRDDNIHHPTGQPGELVYCDKVQELVDEITDFVLRFLPDNHYLGGRMIHECVTMLHQRLTQMEEKSII